MRTRTSVAAACATAAALSLYAAPAGPAKDRDDVRVAGTSTGPSSSKLKLSEEDGRIEVEFEVDQNRAGVRWTVVLRQKGAVVMRATRVTRGPSGSFEARFLARNRPGADTFVATASRPGETCRARASWR
jgi:hypothetical protein